MPIDKGPIPGDLVCERYHIDSDTWKGMKAAERALFRMAYAADEMHVEEHPRGSNRGPEVERMLAAAGVEPGNPWCAASWTCYLIDSGIDRSKLPELAASVHGWGQWADHKGLATHHPGRAFAGLIYHTASTGHLVAIAGVEGDEVRTIEGNSNDEGDREGYEVCRRRRKISEFHSFVDCTKL